MARSSSTAPPSDGLARLRPYQPLLVAAAAVLVASLAAARVVTLVHDHELQLWADVIVGQVERGEAIKPRFASRILAPYSIYYLSQLGLPMITALKAFYAVCMIITNGAAYAAFRRLTGSHQKALYYVFAVTALTVLLLWPRNHGWDYVDLSVFTLLLYGIVARRGLLFFALLFAVGVVNRESAFFVAAWLVIDGLGWRSGRPRLTKKLNLLVAATLGALGAAYTTAARNALFTEAYLVPPVAERHTDVFGHPIRWLENASRLLASPFDPTGLTVVGFVLLTLGAIIVARHRIHGTVAKVLLLLAVMFGGVITFGRIDVSRLYLPFVPLLLYAHHQLYDGSRRSTARSCR